MKCSWILKFGVHGREVQVGRGQHRAADVVRRDQHVVRLGRRRQLARLEDAADVPDVGLDDVHRLGLEQLAELDPVVDALAGRDRQRRVRGDRR